MIENRTSREAQIGLPAWATSKEQVTAAYDLLGEAREQGFLSGIMLVLGTPTNLQPEKAQQILSNLDFAVGLPEAERPGIYIMHPFGPLGENGFNLLTNPQFSIDYIGEGLELVARIPRELTPRTGRLLTVHTNAHLILSPRDELDQERLFRAQEQVFDTIGKIVSEGKKLGVSVALETMPVPEFGDRVRAEESLLPNSSYRWGTLPMPFLYFFGDKKSLKSFVLQVLD